MDEVWLLVGRGLLGGLLVMAFAAIGEATEPKRFAGHLRRGSRRGHRRDDDHRAERR